MPKGYKSILIFLKNEIDIVNIMRGLLNDNWIYEDDIMKLKDKFDRDYKFTGVKLKHKLTREDIDFGVVKEEYLEVPKYFIKGVYNDFAFEEVIGTNFISMDVIKLKPIYGKTGYWEFYESLFIPALLEAGIEIDRLEFRWTYDDFYPYHSIKYYNKKDNGSWEVREDLKTPEAEIRIVEIDGFSIISIDDFINQIDIKMKEKYNINLFKDYKGDYIEKNMLGLECVFNVQLYLRKLEHIIWRNLKYSKKQLGDDFDEIMTFIKYKWIVLDEKKEDGEICRIHEGPQKLPIRKIGKKEEYERELEEHINGTGGVYVESRKKITKNILTLYDYDAIELINERYDFKININGEYKNFIYYTITSSLPSVESINNILRDLNNCLNVLIDSGDSLLDRLLGKLLENNDINDDKFNNAMIIYHLKIYTFFELYEKVK